MQFRSLIILLIITSIHHSLFSQIVLTGLVKMSDQPVKGLTIYTSFGTTISDDLGRYALPLAGCSTCHIGEKISIYTYHEEYGSSEQLCTISRDFKYNISISRNPSKLLIAGIVRNSVPNGELLANINVKVMGIEYEMPPVNTDNFGEFKIFIRKDLLKDKNTVLLQAFDPEKKYKPLHIDPQYYNISSFNTILMVSGISYNIKVSGLASPKICVKEGDAVSMDATGQIRIGSFAGSSDPDGRTSGVMGLSLEQYNIVSNFNHAALLYRFEGENEWKVAGKQKRFVAPRSGCLEFEVNDNSQGDNSGQYDVEISIRPS